jgi:hypothetical protein
MPALKLKQLQHESDAWKRTLGFMSDENIHLKNRLSEVLTSNCNRVFIEAIDVFQTGFVKEDELIALLRNNVSHLDRLFISGIFEDEKAITQIQGKVNNLRNDLMLVEKQFCKLKSDFNNYLSEHL